MITLLTLLLVFESADQVAVQVLGPDIQKTLDISDTVLTGHRQLRRRGPRARHAAARVARRPVQAHPGRGLRRHRLGRLRGAHRPRAERVPDGAHSRRHGPRRLGHHPDLADDHRRPVPDRGPHPHARVRVARAAARLRDRPVHRRRHRHGSGRRRRLALGVHPRRDLPRRHRPRAAHPDAIRSAAASSRRRCSVKPLDVVDPPVRISAAFERLEEGQDLLLPHRRHRPARASRSSRCRCNSACCSATIPRRTSTSTTATARTPAAG